MSLMRKRKLNDTEHVVAKQARVTKATSKNPSVRGVGGFEGVWCELQRERLVLQFHSLTHST